MSIEDILKKTKVVSSPTASNTGNSRIDEILKKTSVVSQAQKPVEENKSKNIFSKIYSGLKEFTVVTSAKTTSGVASTIGAGEEGLSKLGGWTGSLIYKGAGSLVGLFSDKAGDTLKQLGDDLYNQGVKTGKDLNVALSEGGRLASEKILEDSTGYQEYKEKPFREIEDRLKPEQQNLEKEASRLKALESKINNLPDTFNTQKEIDEANKLVNEYNSGIESYNTKVKDFEKRFNEEIQSASNDKFKWSDLTDSDFLLYDLYGSFVENAPTMALTLYTGGTIGAITKGSKVAQFISQTVGMTGFSTGINALRESESAYTQAIQEGASEAEALERSERVFKRNSIGNLGFEALQMATLLSPQLKSLSPFWQKAIGFSKIAGAGGIEAIQERLEDSIQSQSTSENFQLKQLFNDLSRGSVSKTDVISFIMGAGFQGIGNSFLDQSQIEKGVEDFSRLVLENLPEEYRSGSGDNIAKIEKAIDQNPEIVTQAIQNARKQLNESTANIRNQKKVNELEAVARERLRSGESETAVKFELSKKVGAEDAEALVNKLSEEPTIRSENFEAIKPKQDTLETTLKKFKDIQDDVVEKTPTDIQEEFDNINNRFDESNADLKQEISNLESNLKSEKDSKIRAQTEKQIAEQRAELDKQEAQFNKDLKEQATNLRERVSSYASKEFDLNPKELRIVVDSVIGKVNSESKTNKTIRDIVRDRAERVIASRPEVKETKKKTGVKQKTKAPLKKTEKPKDNFEKTKPAKKTKKVSDRLVKKSDFKTDEGVSGTTYNLDDNQKKGTVTVEKNKDGYVMRNILLSKEERGKGLGKEIYRELNRQSIEETGNPLRSIKPTRELEDGTVLTELSEEAIRMWESLVKSGEAVKREDGGFEFIKDTNTDILTGEKLFTMTKKDIKPLLETGLNIPDVGGKAIQKIATATPSKSFSLDTFGMKDALMNYRKEGVFTDSFTLINDKKASEVLYKAVEKKYPDIKPTKDPVPDWKEIVPTERNEVEIQGYVVGTAPNPEVSVILKTADYQNAVNADKLAYLMKEFPNAKMTSGGNQRAIIFEQRGKIKGLVMPLAELPRGTKFTKDSDTRLRVKIDAPQELFDEALNHNTAEDFITLQRTKHRPPEREDGAPLSEVSEMFGDDIYTDNALRYFGFFDRAMDEKAIGIIQSFRSKPDETVTIYRAVGKNEGNEIRPSDWVAITKEYAEFHGNSVLQGNYKILSKEVKANDISTDGNSIQEWGYRPEGTRDFTKEELAQIWEQANERPATRLRKQTGLLNLTKEQANLHAKVQAVVLDIQSGAISEENGRLEIEKLQNEISKTFTPEQQKILENDTLFRVKQKDPENTYVKERVSFLDDIKKRWNIDFDVYFVDSILAGERISQQRSKSIVEAWGAYNDNSIAIARDALENTDRHEVVHLTLDNAQNIPIMVENGVTKKAVLEAKAKEQGLKYENLTDTQKLELEESVAQDFENYRNEKYEPKGIIQKFFELLKKLMDKARSLFNLNEAPDIISEYYDLLDFGEDVNAEVAQIQNSGLFKSFIVDGNLDLRESNFAVNIDESTRRLAVTKLKPKDWWNDKRFMGLSEQYNKVAEQQNKLNEDSVKWEKDIAEHIQKREELADTLQVEDEVKELSRFITKKDPKKLTERGLERAEELGYSEMTAEIESFAERRAELKRTKEHLASVRRRMAELRKDKKTNKSVLRDLERSLKRREKFLQKKTYYVDMGIKRGRAIQQKEMNEELRVQKRRNKRIARIREIYNRTKKATRTGQYLPIDYQNILMDIFANYDFAKMTDKTKKSLENAQKFFENKKDDVSKNLAVKLERLSKTAIADLTDEQIEELGNTIEHIYSIGVLKKRLLKNRKESEKRALINKISEQSINLESSKGVLKKVAKKLGIRDEFITMLSRNNLKTLESFRVADSIDGLKNYKGFNYLELQRPVANGVGRSEIRSDTIISEALSEIVEYGKSFTKEEQARMTYILAKEQGSESQAYALKNHYSEQYDFEKPLTEKERGVVEIIREPFKELRPEVASVYEEQKNIPFPDIKNYFPLKYDINKNTFEIKENPFDFNVTKTKQGFVAERQELVDKVLDINVFDVFARSIKEQIYYIEVQPALDNTREIVSSPEYRQKTGTLVNEFWSTFIEDVATRGRVGGFTDMIRGNISTAILGYKLSSAQIQPMALVDAGATISLEFGIKKVPKLLPQFIKMAISKQARDSAQEHSLALRQRKGGQVEISEIRALSSGRMSDRRYKRWYAWWQRNAYFALQYLDMATASAVQAVFKEEYIKQGMSETDANDRADTLMILTQASSNVADRPHVLNTRSGRFFLTFQTFVVNAFNNVRYDLIESNIKNNGIVKGSWSATTALSFFIIARVLQEMQRDEFFKFMYGADDDEEESTLKKIWSITISEIPILNLFFDFDGNPIWQGRGGSFSNPVVDTLTKGGSNLIKLVGKLYNDKKFDFNNFLSSLTSIGSLAGIAGISQLQQLFKSKFNPIRRRLGLNDWKTNSERLQENAEKFVNSDEKITKEKISEIARYVYGDNYKEGDTKYRNTKDKEVSEMILLYQKFGTDNEIVNGFIEAKNNNERKALFIEAFENDPEVASSTLRDLRKTVVSGGEKYNFVSSQLGKELNFIGQASESDRKFISEIINIGLETDNQAKAEEEIISKINEYSVDQTKRKTFAKKLFSVYKVIDKEIYQRI